MFANKYLHKQNKKALLKNPTSEKLGISVVIPCFQEPDILLTLESLKESWLPTCLIEVIILINHSESSNDQIKKFNTETKQKLDSWICTHPKKGINFHALGPVVLPKKWAGAGLARKRGMDEAIIRFNSINNSKGIVVSLDADTLVDKNYFTEIEKHFHEFPKNVGATISFKHQRVGLDGKHKEGIELYEKYLNYYKSALRYSGYPYAMNTIGSAIAVTAEAYVKRGGMNRRKAGEDFYFLQGLAQIGTVGEITTTKVYPSARLSNRVPFGTGPILQKWMDGKEDLSISYNFKAFENLKVFFDLKQMFYKTDKTKFNQLLNKLPIAISEFIREDNFWEELDDLNRNCSTLQSFNSRFFQKFNAFKILKYLNFVHGKYYDKANLDKQINLLEEQF